MNTTTNEINGNLRISEDVLATIAIHSTCEVDGVAGMGSGPVKIRRLLTSKTLPARSVRIDISDDVAQIDLYVVLQFGARIPEVAEKIQENVKEAVQSMTAIAVSKVNVHISGIAFGQATQ